MFSQSHQSGIETRNHVRKTFKFLDSQSHQSGIETSKGRDPIHRGNSSQSHQSGIETSFRRSHAIPSSLSQSHQSGIETRSAVSCTARVANSQSHQSGIETVLPQNPLLAVRWLSIAPIWNWNRSQDRKRYWSWCSQSHQSGIETTSHFTVFVNLPVQRHPVNVFVNGELGDDRFGRDALFDYPVRKHTDQDAFSIWSGILWAHIPF